MVFLAASVESRTIVRQQTGRFDHPRATAIPTHFLTYDDRAGRPDGGMVAGATNIANWICSIHDSALGHKLIPDSRFRCARCQLTFSTSRVRIKLFTHGLTDF
jgi:hypothetical protein